MNIFRGLFKAEMRMLLRNPFATIFGIAMPIMMLIFQAEVFDETINLQGVDVSIVDMALPMYAMLSLFVLGVGNVGLGLIHTREINFFKRLRLTPATKKHYLTASMLVQLLVAALTITALFLVATLVYSASVPSTLFNSFLITLVISFFMCYFFGIFLGSVFKDPKSAQSVALIIYFGILFLGGFMFPVELFPDFMKKVSFVLPTTHAVKLVQYSWNEISILTGNHLLIVIIATFLCGVLGYKTFKFE